MARAWLIGIAYPSAKPDASGASAAVSIPMTWPFRFTSGPPESPGTICASVSSRLCSVSFWVVPSESCAVIERLTAVIDPLIALGLPPSPSALPIATTGAPTRTAAELPIRT